MSIYLKKGIAYSAFVFGSGSLLLFTSFLYKGSFSLLDFRLGQPQLLWMDAGLCLLFFIQHSAMLRKSLRGYAQKFIPAPYFSAFYAITSGIALFILLIFWQKSSILLMSAGGYHRLFFRLLFLISIIGFIWATRALTVFDPFGMKMIFLHMKNRQPKSMPLTIQGPYKLVRHPLYLFSLLMIWSSPDLSADRLLFNLLWTIWIIIGTLLEERDLVHEFGVEYQKYQKEIPMLIPLKIFSQHV